MAKLYEINNDSQMVQFTPYALVNTSAQKYNVYALLLHTLHASDSRPTGVKLLRLKALHYELEHEGSSRNSSQNKFFTISKIWF